MRDLQPGAQIAGYRLEEVIGRGGMGVVYRAEHMRLRRSAALKLLAPEVAADVAFRTRFEREAELAASLDHPHVIPIYDAGEADGLLYIAMRYVEGEDLRSVLTWEGRLSSERALEILAPIADALDAAHAAGLVHRDVKPANILLESGGRIYLTDFGITRKAGVETALTQAGQVVGTLQYIAPEQARGDPVDGRADQYALACVAFECLTGRRPFDRDSDIALVFAHLNDPPPTVSESRPELAPTDAVLSRGLAKVPADRFESSKAFVSAFARALGTGADAAGDATLAAVPAATTPPPSLPRPPTPFVGRERELEEAGARLREHRLLTLLGPGGSGKTRLALQLTETLASEFADGACWVALDPVRDPQLVPAAVARALGVRETPDRPLEQALEDHVRRRELLLVLDNFEHVVEAAPWLAELLAAAPLIKALVTSRERLRLGAERAYEVGPLAERDAVDLFVERGRAAGGDFEAPGTPAAVVEICVRLDGLPLAIELAAARVSILSPAELSKQLDRRLPVLTGGARDLPERQRTLRATIQWSVELLDETERSLFRRLGIFAGGCTFDSAVAVCGADVETVASLVEKSLVRRHEGRFSMLETIRELALELLDEDPEADELRIRYAQEYLQLAERAEPKLTGAEQDEWLRRLEQEHANLRSVLEWARSDGQPELSLRIAGAIARFWGIRGYLTEGSGWLEDALARGEAAQPDLRAKALIGASLLAQSQGEYTRAGAFSQHALELCEETGDLRGVARALNDLGFVALCAGDHGAAAAAYERAAEAARAAGNTRALAVSIGNLADLALSRGRYAEATELARESLALHRESGDSHGRAITLMNLGIAALRQDRLDDALECLDESLELSSLVGDKEDLCFGLEALAAAFAQAGDFERATRLLGSSDAALEELGAVREPTEAELRRWTLEHIRAHIDAGSFAGAWEAGRRSRLEDAVEDARAAAAQAAGSVSGEDGSPAS